MALCQDTDHVLLEKSLNTLDPKHAAAMMQLVRNAADERGRTVVLVLHDVIVEAGYSDRIVAMRDGVVVEQGPSPTSRRPRSCAGRTTSRSP